MDLGERSNSREKLLTRHVNKSFECDICKKKFTQKASIKNHFKITHRGGRQLKRDICKLEFSQSSTLKVHTRTHIRKNQFKCDICDYKSSRSTNLKMHKMVHTGEKRFHCDTCGKGYINKNNFKDHKMLHTGERPFICDICDGKNLVIFYLMHSLFVPSSRKITRDDNGKKSVIKYSIKDSQNTFIIEASTPLELEVIIEKLKKQENNIQPYSQQGVNSVLNVTGIVIRDKKE
ncbi:zinc finger protein 62 homolog [Metopolophium dirhodum]|nr:zinc finger protein 62 homolog [Metopolophium dirhodum]